MKYLSTIFLSFIAATVMAQNSEEVAQAGTPALLEAANGKKAAVYLQNLEGGNLTFQVSKSPSNMTVPADKINSLKFSMNKEEFDFFRKQNVIGDEEIAEVFKKTGLGNAEKLELIFKSSLANIANLFNQGSYAAVVAVLEPFMLERGQYMAIENNLQDSYARLMESYRMLGDSAKMKICAASLKESSNAKMALKAKANLALLAIETGDFETAGKIGEEMESEAGKLYLKAAMDRAQSNPKAAIKTVTDIIAAYGNDLEWMSRSELLGAYLYLDMGMTNSAAATARQVKNIYAGSNVAADAAKLQESLPVGEETKAVEETEVAESSEVAEMADSAELNGSEEKTETEVKTESE
jgi:hypothetical protein